ncbi:putative transport protein [Caldanaerovirga acetigignens]|uniref:Putative transport protein n=1 Tax=Caldanaerovirga acetigignens TaxID=447595 RepID=A0A1M7LW44_9FIRM|nr:YidE/YbjL duplication [Caldanaerovirga acetigignens]SHM82521.1 putative transport protein [Caldanaerovirga acetigignens]
MESFIKSIMENKFFILFVATALGLMLGKIKIKGISLETSGALFVGLVFGALGYKVDKVLFTFSLVLFVSAVGLLAAKDIGRVVKLYGFKFALLGIIITFAGAFATFALTLMFQGELDPYLVSGTYTGALTSSPGLAAALEATKNNPNITIGHAVAYPFGVILVILFVQLAPIIFKIDVKKELERYRMEMGQGGSSEKVAGEPAKESFNLLSYCIILALGIIIGSVPFKIPGIATPIKLETTGGVLISALILGYFGKIGPLNTMMPKEVLATFRELGLAFFLAIVGIESGAGVVEVVKQSGITLMVIGFVAGVFAELVGFLIGRYVWKINWILLAGAICGGMTSTPGLGAAIDATGTDEVATGYGATYPIALLFMVIWTILLHTVLG